MSAHMAVAHFAVNFSPRYKCRNRVDYDNVKCARACKSLNNFKRLLAVVGLRNKKRVNIDSESRRVNGVKCVLGIDKRRLAACFLSFGNRMKRKRCFT